MCAATLGRWPGSPNAWIWLTRAASCCVAGRANGSGVSEWLPDDPYPKAMVQAWPDQPGEPVTATQLDELEYRVMMLFERIAAACNFSLPERAVILGTDTDTADPGTRLYTLASRIPIGAADRYSVLAAPSAAERLAALSDAVDSVAAVVEFQLSE